MELENLNKRINVDLPLDRLGKLVYHSSYQPQDSSLLRSNKELFSLGFSIIEATYSVYLYLNVRDIDERKFSEIYFQAPNIFANIIYQQYSLEEFVIKSKGEMGVSHN